METKAAAVVSSVKQIKLVHIILASMCVVIAGMAYFGWTYLTRVSPVEEIRGAVAPVGRNAPKWIATVYGEPGTLLSSPRKVHVAGREIYVADTGNNRILVFDFTGQYLRKIGDNGEIGDEGVLAFPYGMALVGNDLYVADAGLNKVLIYDKNGAFKGYFAEESFLKPVDIAYRDGQLFFTDVGHHQVVVVDTNGTETLRFGGPGKVGEGVFWFPNGIVVLPDGRIAVADTNNSRIQIFNATGEFIGLWQGEVDRGQAHFASPSGLAVDREGNVYVADPLTRRVMVVDSDGEPIGAVSVVGNPDDRDTLAIPYGVAIDSQQRLYVVDYGDSRLVIYDLK